MNGRDTSRPAFDAAYAALLEARLVDWFRPFQTCAVALSGGVDSAVVAAAAYRRLGAGAVAITGTSASVSPDELRHAQQVAAAIGIRHEIVATNEFHNPQYLRNAPDRCYHCKTELYDRMHEWLAQETAEIFVNGANLDDLSDYRPGLAAAQEHAVRSPLAECGFHKDDVRLLAQHWNLPVWNKPAAPCLSSRIAYGEEVTPQRLAMVDEGERFLRSRGFPVARVRYHRGDLARVEVPENEVDRLIERDLRRELIEHLKSLGFKYVTIDLGGFQSGSLNALIETIDIKQ